jgi:hypothetical protein
MKDKEKEGKEGIEKQAKQIHDWYLQATKKLNPESYNQNAQKKYDDLTEEQKFIDRYIAGKVFYHTISAISYALESQSIELKEKIKNMPSYLKPTYFVDKEDVINLINSL